MHDCSYSAVFCQSVPSAPWRRQFIPGAVDEQSRTDIPNSHCSVGMCIVVLAFGGHLETPSHVRPNQTLEYI